MRSIDGCVSVACPFGRRINVDIEVDYTLDGHELLDCDIDEPVLVGITIDQQYFPFDSPAGLERVFANAQAELCEGTWQGKIFDACRRDAERKKLLRT